ncbi:hypothetical protein BpHYR1_050397 [Brachionus plicatilis]|uniref:Uncharacterized protein n=1 Tax=Brachionus plicatilis TaxID=10195 RepID=A0A3M7SC78_BRAPC|nr:hypothetical protein BpHYR1_050397 [Brachionus plicatilis]
MHLFKVYLGKLMKPLSPSRLISIEIAINKHLELFRPIIVKFRLSQKPEKDYYLNFVTNEEVYSLNPHSIASYSLNTFFFIVPLKKNVFGIITKKCNVSYELTSSLSR